MNGQNKTIVFCLPGREFSGEFLEAWTHTINETTAKGFTYALSRHYSSVVYYVRNICLGADVLRGRHQKPFDGLFKYDYLMWIDSDVIWNPKQIFTLIDHNVDIVGGVYKMDEHRYAAVKDWDESFFRKHGTFQFLTDKDLDQMSGLTEVAYNGFGFMLIKYGVFESFEYPWFRPIYFDLGNDIYDFTAEDVGFCQTVRDGGFKVYIDPTIKVNHQKMRLL